MMLRLNHFKGNSETIIGLASSGRKPISRFHQIGRRLNRSPWGKTHLISHTLFSSSKTNDQAA
ncbi:hypothetical protein M413DRAFT_238626 [Hebeloma cylindrosporum]|uniref:Uncharacterized protein n=1 Tax=Hebeloma cylindrosporum TaxID=76867 RepID=A0A0C3C5I4_HEBCY|nr:hypothetical protein M413DRAFT_238626 [Hebeloma cylindrosporum h7]